jgi:lycopene beta-cyclase
MLLNASNKPVNNTYDYIVCGAGCAGLSLLMHMIAKGGFENKKILLVDKDPKKTNDRTWCFWEEEEGLFQPIVKKGWQDLWFHADGVSKKLNIRPYQYKLIRGIDFYNHCLQALSKQPGITFLNAPVASLFSDDAKGTGVVLEDGTTYRAAYIFNSILFQKPILTKKQYWLLQHFKGWFVETKAPAFDESTGTLMDFRTSQETGATFFYVLPFSPTQALVEYTLFSKKLLPDEAYEKALQAYVAQTLGIEHYQVTEKEFGVIPMSNYPFPARQNNIINIGTAGRQTKASSGYTFRFIQKNSKAIVDCLLRGDTTFSKAHAAPRFHFYDSVLLHILYNDTLRGADIFADLFRKNKPQQVLKFLDNETSLREELGIISSLPTLPFSKAAVKQLTPLG